MREYVTPIFLSGALNLFAQFPPIVLEWSALRPNGNGWAQVGHDPVIDDYIWAVPDPNPPFHALRFPFLADGTDLAPTYPQAFAVGTYSGPIEFAMDNGTVHALMYHQNISGGGPYWHLDELIMQNANIDFTETALDLLVTDDAMYVAGSSMVSMAPDAYVGRAVKTDLGGNVIWDVTWDPGATGAPGRFSSVAVIGDSVFCAAFPYLIILDPTDGSLIDAYDMFQSIPVVTGDAQLLARDTRLYWVMQQADLLHYGQFDFVMGQGQIGVEIVPGQLYPARIAMDQYDNCWFTTNVPGEGRWYRFDADLNFLSAGTLYNSIYHMVLVNGKISMTGMLDATTSTTYVTTGTPQP